jgi:hypothetical protein
VLKPPGSVLLKLRYDGPLSNFAFKLNLRLYTAEPTVSAVVVLTASYPCVRGMAVQVHPTKSTLKAPGYIS